MYRPRKVTKPDRQYTLYVTDRNSRRFISGPGSGFGGRRRSTVRKVTVRKQSRINARIRIVHLNLKKG